ncbi:MAG: hypothetical protein P1P88_22170 [Bacteroidales bacterium]|nr:hypothetical protein [Bacteroidales bacterium]
MDLDEIKNKWENENIDDVQIPESVKYLRKAQGPIDHIKGHMKSEFIISIITFILLPLIYNFKPAGVLPVFFMIYIIMILIGVYYYYSFYKFYRQMQDFSLNTKDNLWELYYQLRLNVERYKSFNLLMSPFLTILVLLIFSRNNVIIKDGVLINFNLNLYILTGTVVVISIIIILLMNVWVNSLYGTDIKKIKGILDELKEE